jgi:hypothetical protein
VKQAGLPTWSRASEGGPGGTWQASPQFAQPGPTRPSLPNPDPVPQARLIEIRAVDRESARKNMSAGLFAGALAAAVFALCFVAAFLYIAQ